MWTTGLNTGPRVHHGLGPTLASELAGAHAFGLLRPQKLIVAASKWRREQGGPHHGLKMVAEWQRWSGGDD
jgi:hypothetical protein